MRDNVKLIIIILVSCLITSCIFILRDCLKESNKYSYEEIAAKFTEATGEETSSSDIQHACDNEYEGYKAICTREKDKVDNEMKYLKYQYESISESAKNIGQSIVDTVVDETGKMGGN